MACSSICNIFINRSNDSYKPLACKPMTANTRTIEGTGIENKRNYFFLMKPNTMREHATLDLIYEIPFWLKQATRITKQTFTRVTVSGDTRVTVDGDTRIAVEE